MDYTTDDLIRSDAEIAGGDDGAVLSVGSLFFFFERLVTRYETLVRTGTKRIKQHFP